MARQFPFIQPALRHATGIKDATVSRAVRALEDVLADILQRLSRAEQGSGGIAPTRQILTTAPITGGGDLSADRTIGIATFAGSAPGAVPTSSGVSSDVLFSTGSWGSIAAAWGLFGDGSDGNATISSNTTLTKDMFYNNLTVNAGVTLKTAGWRVFVKGTLTLNGTIANNGADASGPTGGLGGAGGFLNAGTNGGNAGAWNITATSGIAAGHTPREFTQGTMPVATMASGASGGIGQGGSGGDNSGGGAGAGGTTSFLVGLQSTHEIFVAMQGHVYGDATALTGGTGGGGARSGPPGGPNNGSVGGGGGGGGGWVVVCAKAITGSGGIQARGGQGGGGTGANGVGGGGGAGGVAVLITNSTTAPTPDASGGLGGTGAAANGGNGGNGLSILYKG